MTSASLQRIRGPLVWGDMDQQALDDAYDQAKWAANQEQVTGRRPTLTARALKFIAAPERRAYGNADMEKLDIYRAGSLLHEPRNFPNAPISIFVHGGAWRRGAAKDYAFQAEMFVRAGGHHVVLDFNNVDELKGDL